MVRASRYSGYGGTDGRNGTGDRRSGYDVRQDAYGFPVERLLQSCERAGSSCAFLVQSFGTAVENPEMVSFHLR